MNSRKYKSVAVDKSESIVINIPYSQIDNDELSINIIDTSTPSEDLSSIDLMRFPKPQLFFTQIPNPLDYVVIEFLSICEVIPLISTSKILNQQVKNFCGGPNTFHQLQSFAKEVNKNEAQAKIAEDIKEKLTHIIPKEKTARQKAEDKKILKPSFILRLLGTLGVATGTTFFGMGLNKKPKAKFAEEENANRNEQLRLEYRKRMQEEEDRVEKNMPIVEDLYDKLYESCPAEKRTEWALMGFFHPFYPDFDLPYQERVIWGCRNRFDDYYRDGLQSANCNMDTYWEYFQSCDGIVYQYIAPPKYSELPYQQTTNYADTLTYVGGFLAGLMLLGTLLGWRPARTCDSTIRRKDIEKDNVNNFMVIAELLIQLNSLNIDTHKPIAEVKTDVEKFIRDNSKNNRGLIHQLRNEQQNKLNSLLKQEKLTPSQAQEGRDIVNRSEMLVKFRKPLPQTGLPKASTLSCEFFFNREFPEQKEAFHATVSRLHPNM